MAVVMTHNAFQAVSCLKVYKTLMAGTVLCNGEFGHGAIQFKF
jgi:hypothetical protein